MQQIFIHYKPKKNSYTQKKNFTPKTSLLKTGSPTFLKHSQSFLSLSKLKASSLSSKKFIPFIIFFLKNMFMLYPFAHRHRHHHN